MAVIDLLAILLAGSAAGLLAGRRPDLLKARLGADAGTGARPSRRPAAQVGRRAGRRRPLVVALRGRRAGGALEGHVADACLALSAELRAGAPVQRALFAVANEWPDLLEPAARAASVGGDVARALRETAELPGAAALRAVAAGWEVTERTGAPLSTVVVAVADALRTEAAVRREAQSQLATARTTARLLAALPLATLLLLSGGDGAAVGFLVTSPYGRVCLGAAVVFVAAGLWWVDRLARSVTRSSWSR
jgi:tight adherence protein B